MDKSTIYIYIAIWKQSELWVYQRVDADGRVWISGRILPASEKASADSGSSQDFQQV